MWTTLFSAAILLLRNKFFAFECDLDCTHCFSRLDKAHNAVSISPYSLHPLYSLITYLPWLLSLLCTPSFLNTQYFNFTLMMSNLRSLPEHYHYLFIYTDLMLSILTFHHYSYSYSYHRYSYSYQERSFAGRIGRHWVFNDVRNGHKDIHHRWRALCTSSATWIEI